MKNKNGITLIALVITIIVLLILAGVTISTLTGENGILTRVEDARKKSKEAEARERVELELAEWGIVKNTQVDADLGNFLTEKFGAENITSNADGSYTVMVDGYKVNVDANGKVTGIAIKETAESTLEVVTSYTAEEIEASEYLYGIGKNDPTYVVAAFNEDYTQVIITKNGENSDGIMTSFAPWEQMSTSPMQDKKDTLETAIIKKGVVNIGEGSAGSGAFTGCIKLKNITIPTSVTSIGQSAFQLCTSITNIEIPTSVTNIRQSVFANCSSLTSVTIPNGVSVIDVTMFNECTSLTNIEIPTSVTKIEYYAFGECTSLTNIEIPSSVTNIEMDSFLNCTNLSKVKIMSTSLSEVGLDAFNNLAPNAKIYVLNEEVKSALEGTYDGTTTVEVVTEEQMKEL